MRLLEPARNPFEAWLRAASWYQATRRWATLLNVTDSEFVSSLDALRDSLQTEAESIVAVYSQGETARHRYVASILPTVWAEIQTSSTESIPTGVGGLGQVPGATSAAWIAGVQAVKNLPGLCWKYGKWLLVAWGFAEVGIPVLKAGLEIVRQAKQLLEDDTEKAVRLHETQMKAAAIRAQLIANCNGNQECIQSVKESFDTIALDDDSCGLLDTPTGTGLGGIMGLVGGYVAAEAVLGWVE